jgi:hypothetical protein
LEPGLKYRITPSSPEEDFSPPYREFTSLDKDEQADFHSVAFTISGVIRTQDNQPVEGVTVYLTSSDKAARGSSVTTDKSGTYSFDKIRKASSYTVRPAKPGNTFIPSIQFLSHPDSNAAANFTMAPLPPRIEVSTDTAEGFKPRKQGDHTYFYVRLKNTGGSTAKNISIEIRWSAPVTKAFTLTPAAPIKMIDSNSDYVTSLWVVEALPANEDRKLEIKATLQYELSGEPLRGADYWIKVDAKLRSFEDEKGKKYQP